jgi:hypothetical protein
MNTTMHSDQNASPPRVEVITSVQRQQSLPLAKAETHFLQIIHEQSVRQPDFIGLKDRFHHSDRRVMGEQRRRYCRLHRRSKQLVKVFFKETLGHSYNNTALRVSLSCQQNKGRPELPRSFLCYGAPLN